MPYFLFLISYFLFLFSFFFLLICSIRLTVVFLTVSYHFLPFLPFLSYFYRFQVMGVSLLIVSLAVIYDEESSFLIGWNSLLLAVFILFNCFYLWKYRNQALERELSRFDFTTEIEQSNKKVQYNNNNTKYHNNNHHNPHNIYSNKYNNNNKKSNKFYDHHYKSYYTSREEAKNEHDNYTIGSQ